MNPAGHLPPLHFRLDVDLVVNAKHSKPVPKWSLMFPSFYSWNFHPKGISFNPFQLPAPQHHRKWISVSSVHRYSHDDSSQSFESQLPIRRRLRRAMRQSQSGPLHSVAFNVLVDSRSASKGLFHGRVRSNIWTFFSGFAMYVVDHDRWWFWRWRNHERIKLQNGHRQSSALLPVPLPGLRRRQVVHLTLQASRGELHHQH